MENSQLIELIQQKANSADPIGGSIKISLGDQVLVIDGSGNSNVVTQEDKEVDCTISTSIETLAKLKSGDLNPMAAMMSGKIKISGDMSLAMKLQSLI